MAPWSIDWLINTFGGAMGINLGIEMASKAYPQSGR